MHQRLVWTLFCVLLLPGTVGCSFSSVDQGVIPTVVEPAPTAMIAVEPTTTSLAATPTTPVPTSTPTVSPTTSPTPTPTVLAPLAIAVPPQWELEALQAARALSAAQVWQLVVSDNPSQLLNEGEVQAALQPDDAGYEAGSRPVALTVPFSSDWDGVSLAEALEIVERGHEFVSVLTWNELTPERRALRVEGMHISDGDYPLQQSWSIHAAARATVAAELFAEQLRLTSEAGDVQLAAVGDIMLDRALGDAVAAGDVGFPFAFVAGILQQADYTIGNLESALGDVGAAADKSYTFIAPPPAARSLAEAGFDLLSLANNHGMDFGPDALLQGLSLLEAEGIAAVGAGPDGDGAYAPHIVDVNGIHFGFLGYVNVPVEGRSPFFDTASWTAAEGTPGLAWAQPDIVAEDVSALGEDVDHVVVILHSGYEYVPSPSPEQMASARAAVDAGAALVIGHHAHILQGVEFRGKGVIVYGLGNFAFNITGPPETAILNAWFDEEGLRQIDFIGATIQGSGQPMPATDEDGASIRRQIFALSRSLN